MLTLWNQFDDLFASDDLWRGLARASERKFLPAVDIRETKDGYILTADVPGVAADGVDISVKEGVLTLSGERTHESRTSEAGYQRVERSSGKFQRSFVLPKGVNADAIEARMENGVLTVNVPKPVAALPRKVTVQVGEGASAPVVTEGERKTG